MSVDQVRSWGVEVSYAGSSCYAVRIMLRPRTAPNTEHTC